MPESTTPPPQASSQWSFLNPSLHEMVVSCEASLQQQLLLSINHDKDSGNENEMNDKSDTTTMTAPTVADTLSQLTPDAHHPNKAYDYLINQFERREQQLLRENEALRKRELQHQEELKSKDKLLDQHIQYQQRQHDDHNRQLATLQLQLVALQQHILQNSTTLNNPTTHMPSNLIHNTQPRSATKRDNTHLPAPHQQDDEENDVDGNNQSTSTTTLAQSIPTAVKRHKPNSQQDSDEE